MAYYSGLCSPVVKNTAVDEERSGLAERGA